MSLISPKYLEPARRGRHGAHYKLIGGKMGMVMFNTQMVKRLCECGRWIYDETECMYCGRDLSKVEPIQISLDVKDAFTDINAKRGEG